MNRGISQNGYALLALTILLLMLGLASREVHNSEVFRQSLSLQQQAREAQTLEQIRASLLGFAANQGLHSQSHLGHLPCPAIGPGEHAQTSCLNKAWGYLPLHSKIAVNYLNAGIDARFNEQEPSTNTQWQYAVSGQLVQPNALGWGRWVDYSKPSIQVRIPDENNHREFNVVAVVAKTIKPTAEHQYDISPPYILVHLRELQAHMKRVQLHHLNNTLKTWQQINPEFNTSIGYHENLVPSTQRGNLHQPVDSGCQCRCTKTRCSCHCYNAGKWTSPASCQDNNANCASSNTQTNCESKANEPCVFMGPASMQNLWPVSRFEPIAASNKSCLPTQRNQCPLSADHTACTCHFSWPDNTLSSLDQFNFKLPAKP